MSVSDSSYRYFVFQRIKHIFTIARQAVLFDERKEFGKALTLYSVCSTLITSEINAWDPCCGETIKMCLIRLRSLYNYRLDSIHETQVESFSAGCVFQNDNVRLDNFPIVKSPPLNVATVDPYRHKDTLKYRLLLFKHITESPPFTENVSIPLHIFDFDNVQIPMFNEKIRVFEQLKSVSFKENSPNILLQSVELIFNALYELRREAAAKMNYITELNLVSVTNPISVVRESIEIFPQSPLTKDDLKKYRHLLNESIETLASLSAFEYVATEARKRTPEEVERDAKTYIMVKDCQLLADRVFIPLVMADMYHLSAVYLDYRKNELLEL